MLESTLPIAFMSFGFTEMIVIGVVALLVFGGDLPDVMRSLGRAYGKFRQGLTEMSKPVREEVRRVSESLDASAPSITTTRPTTTKRTPAPPPPAGEQDAGSPDSSSTAGGDEKPSSGSVWDRLDEPPPV